MPVPINKEPSNWPPAGAAARGGEGDHHVNLIGLFMKMEAHDGAFIELDGGVGFLARDAGGAVRRIALLYRARDRQAPEGLLKVMKRYGEAHPKALKHLVRTPEAGGLIEPLKSEAPRLGFVNQTTGLFLDSTFRSDEAKDSGHEIKRYKGLLAAGPTPIAQPGWLLDSPRRYAQLLRNETTAPLLPDVLATLQAETIAAQSDAALKQIDAAPTSRGRLTVVLAGAGCGKSMLHKRLTTRHYDAFQILKGRHMLAPRPIAVDPRELKDGVDDTQDLLTRIANTRAALDTRLTLPMLKFLVVSGAAAFFFDGTEEVFGKDDGYFPTLMSWAAPKGSLAHITVFVRSALFATQSPLLERLTAEAEDGALRLIGLAPWTAREWRRLAVAKCATSPAAPLVERVHEAAKRLRVEAPEDLSDPSTKAQLARLFSSFAQLTAKQAEALVHGMTPSARAEGFVHDVESREALRRMARTPWFAAKLVDHYYEPFRLPRDEFDMLDELVDGMLDRERDKVRFDYADLLPAAFKDGLRAWRRTARGPADFETLKDALRDGPTPFAWARRLPQQAVDATRAALSRPKGRITDRDLDAFIAELGLARCRRLLEAIAHRTQTRAWNPDLAELPRDEMRGLLVAALRAPNPFARVGVGDPPKGATALFGAAQAPLGLDAALEARICLGFGAFTLLSPDATPDQLRFDSELVGDFLAGREIARRIAQGSLSAGDIGPRRDFADDDAMIRKACLRQLETVYRPIVEADAPQNAVRRALSRNAFDNPTEKRNARSLLPELERICG